MQSDPYSIRRAHPADLPILPVIEQAAGQRFVTTPHAMMADFALSSEHVDLDREQAWVAVDAADQPVGFAIVHDHGDAAHLDELDVHPDHARRGLGRRLIETAAEWARAQGMHAMTLTTFRDVPWNGPYYARLGFRTLDAKSYSPYLQRIWDAEAAAGFPAEHRICMQLDL